MNGMLKKVISVVLIASVVCTMLPLQVFATSLNPIDNVSDVFLQEIEKESEPIITCESDVDISEENGLTSDDSELQNLEAPPAVRSTSFEFSTLSGSIKDTSGNGISGVSVQIYNLDENVVLTLCTTNSSGAWASVEYDAIAGYTYIIRYYKAGYEFSTNKIEIIAEIGITSVPDVTATALEIGNLICNETDYSYTVASEKATITKYTGSDIAILLPSSLGGYPVVAIGNSAFEKNKTVETVCLSDEITSVVSYAFQNCTNLKDIYFPSGLTTIDSYAFSGCTSLTNIALPNGLLTINGNAFKDCTGFTAIELPDSVKTIGQYAFRNCTNLSSINYPASWSSASEGIFNGCAKLTSITVPEGVTSIPAYAFRYADYLKTVTLPSTLTTIGSYAFSGCTALRFILVPANVTSVGQYAFSGCGVLRYVMFVGSKCEIGYGSFNNSPLAFLYCPWTSDITRYAIKNNIKFQPLEASNADYSNYVIDMNNTNYYTTSTIAQVEGHVPLTLNYAFKDTSFINISNCRLTLCFTSSLSIKANSIYVNGIKLNDKDVDYNENELVIPLKSKTGTVQLSVTPVVAGVMASYAQITYSKLGIKGSDTIGIIYLDAPTLKISVPALIGGNAIDITGVTASNETVLFSIDNVSVGSAMSKKDGTYSTMLSIPSEPISGHTYTVKATLQSDSSISTSASVVYKDDAPILTQFDLYYYGNDIKYLNLLDTSQTKANSIWPSKPLKFVIHFDHATSIADVIVTSTKNGLMSKMQATATGVEGEYIAEGFFEGTNSSYVPGMVNVQYSTKGTVEDYSYDLRKDELPKQWADSSVEITKNTATDYRATVILSNGDKAEFENNDNVTLAALQDFLLPTQSVTQQTMYLKNISLQSASEEWEAVLGFFKDLKDTYKENMMSNAENLYTSGEQDVVAVIKDDTEQKLIYVFWDSAKDAFRTAGIKFVGTNWIYENSIGVAWADSASAWGFIANGTNVVIHAYNQSISLNDAEADIRSSNLTAEQQAYAMEKVGQLRWAYAATSMLRVVATAAGYGFAVTGNPLVGTLVSTVLNFAANLADNYLNKSLAYYAAGGQGSYLKWLIDPSGYVYDAGTNERLEGVTVTAYYIPCDETDPTFWDTPPDQSAYGTLWDASEYSQKNPTSTDSKGSYAWDVPEGWWRVKYERSEYATVWSDWMTVPPVQTDVNIGMTSTVVDGYAIKLACSTTTSTTVTLTNNTTLGVDIQFIAAAYNSDGQMVSCNAVRQTLAAAGTISQTVTYAANDNVYRIKIFVLNSNSMTPLREAWTMHISQ